MHSAKKLRLGIIFGLFTVCLTHTKLQAASSGTVNVQVSVNATKSLSVSLSTYSFGALAINISSIATPITVTNDSLALQESYALQGANAVSTGGGTTWTLANSTGALDVYSLQVEFSSSTPINADSAWGNPATNLTTSIQNCTSGSTFGNGTVGESCFNVFPVASYSARNMFIRMHTPLLVTDTTQRRAGIILTIQ